MLLLRAMLLALLFCRVASSADYAGGPCRTIDYKNVGYIVCSFDPATSEIRIFNADRQGKPFGSFNALEAFLKQSGETMLFATNGGMYHFDLLPVGLLIENGAEKKAASTRSGWGNFHLLPNGVFFVQDGKAGVKETHAYLQEGLKPSFATQSGPMLVIDGKLHPRFLPQSDSLKIRNGVGVDGEGRVHFAISQAPVRFYDFATLFRDELKCPNALFLDGTISSLYWPEGDGRDSLFPLGPIIAVVGPSVDD